MLCCAVLSCSVVSDSFDPMDCSLPGSSVLGDSPCKNTGVGYDGLLQGIFPTQGSNPVLCHCSEVLHHLSHQGSPRILEWVACPFSRGSPDPGIELGSPALQADSLPPELPGTPGTGMYALLYLKLNKDLLYSTGNTAHCSITTYMGKEFEKEEIHV